MKRNSHYLVRLGELLGLVLEFCERLLEAFCVAFGIWHHGTATRHADV